MRAMQFNSWLLFADELCLWWQQAGKDTTIWNIHIRGWNILILHRIKRFAVECKTAAGVSGNTNEAGFFFLFPPRGGYKDDMCRVPFIHSVPV